MKTLIFDIDGTITDIWPIERSVLLCMLGPKYEKDIEALRSSGITDTWKIFNTVSGRKVVKRSYYDSYNSVFKSLLQNGLLPNPVKYPICDWILRQGADLRFLYASGGQREEIIYVLRQLGLLGLFDLENSIDKSNCRFSKKTGIPFLKIRSKFKGCLLVTDSQSDCDGARLAGVDFIKIKPGQADRINLPTS